MTNRQIPTLDNIIQENENVLNVENTYNKYNKLNIPNVIHNYYSEYSNIDIKEYLFYDENNKHKVKSILGVDNNNKLNSENIKVNDDYFMEYSEDILDYLDINYINMTNGEIAEITYIDNKINVGSTNYFSSISFSKILLNELIYAKENNKLTENNFPIRNKLLKTKNNFKNSQRPISASAGGVIIANTNDGWKLLLGKRSNKTNINKNRLSIFPNGKVDYKDCIKNGFITTVKREFKEELFNNSPKGEMFFDDYVTAKPLLTGWNLRDGDLSVSYILIINSNMGYDLFKNTVESNYEIDNIVEIPIDNLAEIQKKITFENMSPTPVAFVCEALKYIDSNIKYPDLPYNIESI